MVSRALLVGVPTTDVPDLPPLDGAPHDVRRIAGVLTDRGFDEIEMHPEGLDVAPFKKRLFDLRARTTDNDMALVYFSGHGFRLPTHDRAEADGHDECLVLSDDVLADNWFRAAFWTPDIHGRWITCADTCFGATAFLEYNLLRADEHRDSGEAVHVAAELDVVTVPIDILGTAVTVDVPVEVVDVHALRQTGIARVSLAAAGEGESAQQTTQGRLISSWYTDRIVETIEADPATTYATLWTQLQRRWAVDRLSFHDPLGEPWMSSSDAARSMLSAPAFAALDFRP